MRIEMAGDFEDGGDFEPDVWTEQECYIRIINNTTLEVENSEYFNDSDEGAEWAVHMLCEEPELYASIVRVERRYVEVQRWYEE